MKKLPVGIQNICEILSNDYLYVDKTGFAYALINNAKHYFMSRPRRFGKSLFLSTLKEIFSGNQKLFERCFISESDYKWEKHPVVHFDFARIASNSEEVFKVGLTEALEDIAASHKISISGSLFQTQLTRLIMTLSKQNSVVVLVDEYDSAIINHLRQPEIAEKNRDLLRDFFSTLKSLDKYLKFTFVTGISKFSQVSLFSGPNNLTDITMDPRYAAMMGYTEKELRKAFQTHIKTIPNRRGLDSEEAVVDEIRSWYNGYRFTEKELSVYNPYSTLRYLDIAKPKSFWYRSGTPSFLIDQVRSYPQSVITLSKTTATESTLSDISRIDRIHFGALMFQTGYLTIGNYNPEEDSYDLAFPNKEVKRAFFDSLLQEFAEIDALEVSRVAKEIKQDLEDLAIEAFINKMNAHFARMPHNSFKNAKEGFYQAVFYTFLITSGIKVESEMATNIGRIDLLIESPKTIFVLELKVDKTADIALTQAMTKKYRDRFSQSKKETLVMGINFSSKSRDIGDWKAILYSPSGDTIREILPSR